MPEQGDGGQARRGGRVHSTINNLKFHLFVIFVSLVVFCAFRACVVIFDLETSEHQKR